MNYEEKYKEALERAKKFEEKYGGDYAGYIFPELAESEDERIRKALVWHLKADVDSVSNGVTKAECLAYLEKQKGIDLLLSLRKPVSASICTCQSTGIKRQIERNLTRG